MPARKPKPKRQQPPPTVIAHLARRGRRWAWLCDHCPICGAGHNFDAGPASGPPIVAPGLSICEGQLFVVQPACLGPARCAGCPAATSPN